MHGGEQDVRHDDDFNQDWGGRPKADDADSEVVGRQWRDNFRDEISRRRLIRPATNWYCSNNCIFMQ